MSSNTPPPSNMLRSRFHQPTNRSYAREEAAGLGYHHLSPRMPRPRVTFGPNALQYPEHIRKPAPLEGKEFGGIIQVPAQSAEKQEKPSLLAKAANAKSKLLDSNKHAANDTQALKGRTQAMRRAPVPLYAHQKSVRFHDAPQSPPLVHTQSVPALRAPMAWPLQAQLSASARGYGFPSRYDGHSTGGRDVRRHASLDDVPVDRPLRSTGDAASDRAVSTRSERGHHPGDTRRPAAMDSDGGPSPGGLRPSSVAGTVSVRSDDAGSNALSIQRTGSEKYARSKSYPPTSPSRLHELAPTLSVPNMRQRNGSISSMDYGRLGAAGITNRMSLLTTPVSQSPPASAREKIRSDNAAESRRALAPPGTRKGPPPHKDNCTCEPCSPPHDAGCVCPPCYQHRAKRMYKACKVYERLDTLSTTCQRLRQSIAATQHHHHHRRHADPELANVAADLHELGRVRDWADHLANSAPSSRDALFPFHGEPAGGEAQRFGELMRMISSWEDSVREAEVLLAGLEEGQDEAREAGVRRRRRVVRVVREGPGPSRRRYYHGREPEPGPAVGVGEGEGVVETPPVSPRSWNVATNF
ncbi:hypothetical protein LTR36_009388 [Oleoguttula mirabilis]|uniref:Uncharacterized protein n=1 Tax=Oleoguttula mirabilis TaxID=1507867 RepID=A0AAV9JSN4_9PEZI|nr:hypothetical protein LTR36_009388 [Oleoguttula mirabilis]